MKKLYILLFFCLTTSLTFAQTEIFNVAGGGPLPTNWAGTNNVVTNDIDRTSYYLVDAGNPSDIIETDVYNLSSYISAEFKLDVATFGSGDNNPAKIEISFDGGSTYTQTTTSNTPTSSTYIDGGTIVLNSLTSQVKIRISNNGQSGRGVRLKNLILLAYDSNPLITVGADVSGLNYVVGGMSSEGSFTVEGSNLTDDIVLVPPTDFEISESSGSGFVDTFITLNQSGGTIATTTIYARLKSGLSAGSYSGNVNITSTGADPKSVSLSGNVFNPVTNSMKITGVYDAFNNSTPKGIELYVINNIPDLSIYGVGSANNGGGTDGQEFTFPSVSVNAGTYIYVTTDLVGFNAFFNSSLTNYEDGAMSINGDDAIELFESGQVIDVFGDINVDGSGQPWDYVDGWAYRVDATGPDGSTFQLSNWTFSGTGNLDGTTNASSSVPFPSNSPLLSDRNFELLNFSFSPNPTSVGYINISSKSQSTLKVNVFDILGKQVIDTTLTNERLDVSGLTSGIYVMKVSQDNATITKKLVIK